MKRFISFSGGVESTAMCILYGRGSSAIWCDTGAEHDLMYERIDYVEKRLKEIHEGDFELIRVSNEKEVGLEPYILKAKYMPSSMARFCTRMFKIEPIDRFLKGQGECELMIGFNLDEEGRTGNLEKLDNVSYTYPLIEDGLTRDDCEEILRGADLHPNFPAYMSRGGCRMCFFKSEKEYKALWYLNRNEFNKMIEFEDKYQDNREKFFAIMPSGKSLRQLAKECEQEMFHDEIIDMYKQIKREAKSCGAFCHR